MNKNLVLMSVLMFALVATQAFACETPANNSVYIVNTSTVLCDGTYNDTHIVINSDYGILNCNGSVFDGVNYTGTGITLSGINNYFITNCTIKNFEVGIVEADSNDTDFSDIILQDNGLFGLNTYRTTYLDFQWSDVINCSTGIRLEDNSDHNAISTGVRLVQNDNYGLVLANSNFNIINDIETNDGLYGMAITGSNNTISYNDIHYHMYGISIENNSVNNTILSNEIYEILSDAIWFTEGNVTNNYANSNDIHNISYGIYFDTSTMNYAYNNDIYNILSRAIDVDNSKNNSITYNRIDNAEYDGITVYLSNYTVINYNNISNIGTLFSAKAISLEDSFYNYMGGNRMEDIYDTGIRNYCNDGSYETHNDFIGNIVILDDVKYDWQYGFQEMCSNNTYTGNSVINGTDGFDVYASNNTFNANTACGNILDIYDETGDDNLWDETICDITYPDGLCEHPCGYVPPIPPTPSTVDTQVIVMSALAVLLWILGGFFMLQKMKIDSKEFVISLIILGVGAAVIIAAIGML